MATLVNRIKDRAHRRSGSTSSQELPGSSDVAATNGRSPVEKLPNSVRHDAPPRVSLDTSAFHVSRGGDRKSLDTPAGQTRSQIVQGNTMNDYKRNSNMMEQDSRAGETVPGRGSSRYGTQTASGNGYDTMRGDQARYDQGASTRDPSRLAMSSPSATRQNRLRSPGMDGYNEEYADGAPSQQYGESGSSLRGNNRYTVGNQDSSARDNNTSVPLRKDSLPLARKPLPTSPASPSQPGHNSRVPGGWPAPTDAQHYGGGENGENYPLVESQTRNILDKPGHAGRAKYQGEQATAGGAGGAAGHMRLPEGFNLQNSEVTHVTEEYRPAVTHEAVMHERHEIIQEEITRDIHVHHYYTYVQPVRVVDVLPPKHYFLDVQTGVKTQIQTPAGWRMPVSMAPLSPDLSMVKGWSRDYLVNEEHPHGVPEVFELKHERAIDNLRERATRASRNI